jgi:NAD(P)H-dependent flavin oxidoreductase YrpB (nitropropane dioxygenase family)
MDTLAKYLTPQVRQWLYVILTATVPLLMAYGILDAEKAALWLGMGGAVLGTGTAAIAVATQRKNGTLPATPEAPPPGG